MEDAIIYGAACLFGYALIERRLAATPITGPIVFVLLGLLAAPGALGIVDSDSADVALIVETVFQMTLILLLFTDAAALHLSSWRQDVALPARLLGLCLPLTIALGALAAAVLFSDLGIWEAAIIGAIVAPTDAALGQAVISNPRVPERTRHALGIESGLNDGIALPFVLIFIGLAEESEGTGGVATFLREIGVAVVVGVVVGFVGGWLLIWASKRSWVGSIWSSIAVIALAGMAFVVADAMGGSGFIACFVGGLTYGNATRDQIQENETVAVTLGDALVQVSFLAFGAVLLDPALEVMTWQVVVMAVLALTVVRVGPVALSMSGTELRVPTVLYLGWYGPRGLATIVFAALVVTEADLRGADTIVTVAVITVALSVFSHGLSAYPGAQRYADWYESHEEPDELSEATPVHSHPKRSRIHKEGPTTNGPGR